VRRALTYFNPKGKLKGLLKSREGISQFELRTRDHALYPCPTMKDSKWAFKPVPCRNTTAALCNLCLTITAMSRTLGQLEGVFRQGA